MSRWIAGLGLTLWSTLIPTSAGIVNRWSFDAPAGNAPPGTAMVDSISGAVATVKGGGTNVQVSTFNGSALRIHGTTNGNHTTNFMSGYVDLPNGLISSKTNLSVEIWATPYSAPYYGRVFDFGRCNLTAGSGAAPGEIIDAATQGSTPGISDADDNLYMSFSVGTNGNAQRMDAMINDDTSNPDPGHDSALATTFGTRYHYVFTFEDGVGAYGAAGGRVSWYRDGSLVHTADVGFLLNEVEDVNNWLGRSQWTGDFNADASYDEVRIYDHALGLAEIAANFTAGPDTLVDPPPPLDPPTPDHLWTFTTQADSTAEPGTVFTDEIGGSWEATLRGNCGQLTGSAVVLPGTTTGNQPASTISAYIDLSNGIVSASPSVTFEAWATPLSSKDWQRLFDFGRTVSSSGGGATGEIIDDTAAPGLTDAWDNLSLTFNDGGNINSQQLEGEYDNNGYVSSFSAAATTPGQEYHYVLVVEDNASGCHVSWYRNGVIRNTMDFAFHIDGIEDVNNWIGRSMYSSDSNSHMALNELRIYRRALSPAEIVSSLNAGPDPSSGPPEPPAPAPIPARLWNFNAPAGPVIADTVFNDISTHATQAVVHGNNALLTGSELIIGDNGVGGRQTTGSAVSRDNISAYLELPNGFISSFSDLTVEAWITPRSSGNWQRLWDFGNCTVTHGTGAEPGEIIDDGTAPNGFNGNDSLFLSMNVAGDLNAQRLGGKLGNGAETGLNSAVPTTAGTEYHYVMSVDDGSGAYGASGCQVKWYRDKVLVSAIDLPFHLRDMADVNNWIGRSNWSADQNSHMAINELRVYHRAISQQEINTSFAAGANAVFPQPTANNDSATLHSGQKVLIDVLANDTGEPDAATVEIVTPPSSGTATIVNGGILYAHSGGGTAPDSFTYRVSGVGGVSNTATVSATISTALRISNPALAMPAAPPVNTWRMVDALPGLTFNEPLCIASIPGDSHRMFVCERMANIQHIPDVTATTPVRNTFLDLMALVAGRPAETIEGGGNNEHGLLGLAFHPDYASNGYFFVAYTVRINGGSFYQRVSRFQVSAGDPNAADPDSELILLQQLDEGPNHDGGDLHFGPDGYLYYAAGDEENGNDWRLNSQRVDKDFFAGIFRIDVDKRPGNPEPNPHASIPTDGGVARFSVPIDNPFVPVAAGGAWDGIYNGSTVTGTVRTEFWATGLRHTWRFSIDSATGDIWGGDVGQDTYEEVNKIIKGGNYGWVFREGAHDITTSNSGWPAKPSPFVSIDPFYEYVHTAIPGGDASFKGNSVVGGYVYRGTRFPALAGSYVFSDSVSGHVWQMDTTTGATTRLTGMPGAYGVISAQGEDPYDKDLLFCAYLTGKIMRLSTGSSVTNGFPATLGATGLFADLADLSPAPGLLPVQANLKFWSDHADKSRWFAIPDADSRMTWQREGPWTWPAGMLWVKHFDLALSRDNPATNKRIETRILVKTDTGAYGVSYRWNEEGTEAYLVEDAGDEFDLAIDDHGSPHTQHWQIPGRSSCLTCHGDRPLSFNTRQLNRVASMNGFTGNQIDLLAAGGFLDNTPDPASTLPFHVRPDETGYSLEQRARSYFDVNCAYCHQDGGSVSGFWDGRESLTLEETGLIHGVAENNGGNPANQYVVPGDTTHSIVLNRMAATNGFARMPPLGSTEVDPANIQLVTEWINNELPNRPLYDQWRDTYFATLDPNGDRDADPDGDGLGNHAEFLLGSHPLSGSGSWQASIGADGSGATLGFLRKAHRIYTIETSNDLVHWAPWDVPENHAGYGAADEQTEIHFTPQPGGKTFFRFQVTEP